VLRLLVSLSLSWSVIAAAKGETPVEVRAKSVGKAEQILAAQIGKRFRDENLRKVRVEIHPKFALARLFARGLHRFETVRVDFNSAYEITKIQRHYVARAERTVTNVSCPDDATEFISFAPNNDDFEQGIARDVANEAQAKGLKTVLLLGEAATRQAYMNYMSCPNLKGNFYDGDSNPEEMITADESITAQDYATTLKGAFRFRVTNIWLACEAFNNPMLDSAMNQAASQKYAAGINDLQVGPSDNAAACAMKAAINGQPMTAAFQACYQQLDNSEDHWGFDGQGSDLFGQAKD
jgi:hypothetical protein